MTEYCRGALPSNPRRLTIASRIARHWSEVDVPRLAPSTQWSGFGFCHSASIIGKKFDEIDLNTDEFRGSHLFDVMEGSVYSYYIATQMQYILTKSADGYASYVYQDFVEFVTNGWREGHYQAGRQSVVVKTCSDHQIACIADVAELTLIDTILAGIRFELPELAIGVDHLKNLVEVK